MLATTSRVRQTGGEASIICRNFRDKSTRSGAVPGKTDHQLKLFQMAGLDRLCLYLPAGIAASRRPGTASPVWWRRRNCGACSCDEPPQQLAEHWRSVYQRMPRRRSAVPVVFAASRARARTRSAATGPVFARVDDGGLAHGGSTGQPAAVVICPDSPEDVPGIPKWAGRHLAGHARSWSPPDGSRPLSVRG